MTARSAQERAQRQTSFIGDAEAEADGGLQSERSSTGTYRGRRWRDANNGGWFSYRLPVNATADLNLVCTDWGGETGNRVFDILAEDTWIATQTLDQAFKRLALPCLGHAVYSRGGRGPKELSQIAAPEEILTPRELG